MSQSDLEHSASQIESINQYSVAMVTRIFSASGGLELYAHRLIEGLLEKGHFVTVLCEQNHSDFAHKNLSIVQISPPPKKSSKGERLDYYFSEFSKKIEELGPFDIVHTQHIPVKNADIAHFHNHTIQRIIKNGRVWEGYINSLKLRLMSSYKQRDKYDRFLASQAKVLIFPSSICKRDYENAYELLKFRNEASHIVAYPGASLTFSKMEVDDIPPNISLAQQPEPYTFLFVGRGYRTKGLDVLLQACSRLSKDINYKLLIVGLRAKTLDKLRLKVLGIEKRVHYLGFETNMASVYPGANAMIQPSRYETFGMSVLQGMCYGLIPVVSAVSGCSDVLTHEHDALILENHLDAAALSSLMKDLIDKPGLAKHLSKQAKITSSRFYWQRTVDVVISAYELLIKQKSAQKRFSALT